MSTILEENINISFQIKNNVVVKRGDIWLADMSYSIGSEQSGVRYVLVIGNDIGNRFSPTVEVCCITSQVKRFIPTHVKLPLGNGLPKESIILTEQKRTIDKNRLINRVGKLSNEVMHQVNKALIISLELEEYIQEYVQEYLQKTQCVYA